MKPEIFLPAGSVFEGDTNRRWSGKEILNIRGFYDQDSHIMPERFAEHRRVLVNGEESSWGEYVPASYDGSKPVPLVISRHGGGQSGWGQCYATSWCYVADREGFIVLYPDANKCFFAHDDGNGNIVGGFRLHVQKDDFEAAELTAMIDDLASRYNIDRGRIFIQGMSAGDLMSMQYALANGSALAGIGHATGPAEADQFFDADGAPMQHETYVPAFVSFCSNNNAFIPPEQRPADRMGWKELQNLRFWLAVNGCDPLPKIKIDGIENYAFYSGGNAPVAYRDVLGRGHGQTFDDADMLWRTLFSGLRRNADGTVTFTEPDETDYDIHGVAVASGRSFAYVGSVKTPLDSRSTVAYEVDHTADLSGLPFEPLAYHALAYERVMYVPVTFLRTFGCEVEVSECGQYASVTAPDGRVMKVSAGNTGVVIDNRIHSLERHAELNDGVLCVPLRWFAYELGLHCTQRDGVLYVNTKHCELTPNMASILDDILK